MLKFVPCKKPTSDSQKAHYFQWWIQVQDWETGFFGVQTLETELNFIALLSEYLYTTTTWAQPKNIWSLDPLNTLQFCFGKYLCVNCLDYPLFWESRVTTIVPHHPLPF